MAKPYSLEHREALAGGTALDFNSLLTSILGNCNLGSTILPPESPALPYLDQIKRAALRATVISRQMLANTNSGEVLTVRLDLNQLVRELSERLAVSLSARSFIRYDLTPNLPEILADPAQMRQLVMAMATHAAEAIPEGTTGSLVLRSEALRVESSSISVSSHPMDLSTGRYVTLEVSETGGDMTPETIARMFKPYSPGGLSGREKGLSALLRIVHSHGGGLNVYCQPGRGTSMKVFLPAADPSPWWWWMTKSDPGQ